MKNERSKAFWHTRVGKVLIGGVVVIGTSILGTLSANASLLDELKQFNTNVLKQFSIASEALATNINNYTNIAIGDVKDLVGQWGQYDPTQLVKKIADSKSPQDYSSDVLETGRAVNALSAGQVLSKEAQENAAQIQKENTELNSNTVALADDVFNLGEEAQLSQSSQEILKKIARQMSGQTDINASLMQMSVLNANSNQELKMQTAAINQGIASNLEQEQGKNQKESIKELRESLSQVRNQWNNFNSH
jgi:flagellin-specific chaperone FliS